MKDPINNKLDKILAYMSKEAYQPNDKRRGTLCGFTFLKKKSQKRVATYVGRYKDKPYYVFACRGTKPTDVSDLDADLAIATGTFPFHPVFKDVLNFVQDIVKQLRDKSIRFMVTGHSLGGGLAMHIMRKSKFAEKIDYCAIWNPGIVLVFGDGKHKKKVKQGSRKACRLYRTSKDPVSAIVGMQTKNPQYKIHIVQSKRGLNSHTIDQFIYINPKKC